MAAFRPKLSRAPSIWADTDENVAGRLKDYAEAAGLDIAGGTVRRTSSRFCLGVEHGDYNGTALFGVGTDRYIWVAYKPNASGRCRLYSANFEAAGVAAGVLRPATGAIDYVPLGEDHEDYAIVALDTGTDRPGLDKSTYKRRFDAMMDAWRPGGVATVGALFARAPGLRDDYAISGPELETMCDIARTVDGVYGERMLGGGDKGALGAIVAAASARVFSAVRRAYPKAHPAYKDKFATHVVHPCDGVAVLPGCSSRRF
ncbi:galactokinase [Aureococcus anophagefferens]|uniref:Galactokinase n=1 Tax=Aureococcus anophagefferens TaxID=44056 RepID=A0ABR1FMP5_AURAN